MCWSAQGRWSPATQTGGSATWCVQSTRHGKNHRRCSAVPPARESSEERAHSLNSLVSRSQEQNDVTARLRSEKLNMRCTCCLLILTLWSAAAGCNNRMPMCIGSFSYTRSGLVSLSEIPIRRSSDVTRSDRLIGNCSYFFTATRSEMLFVILTHMSSKGQASNTKPSRGLENSVSLNFLPLRSVVHCSLQVVNKIFVDKQSD